MGTSSISHKSILLGTLLFEPHLCLRSCNRLILGRMAEANGLWSDSASVAYTLETHCGHLAGITAKLSVVILHCHMERWERHRCYSIKHVPT